jgi:tripartite-type tricarboxylate transporter receptor subunit TctC
MSQALPGYQMTSWLAISAPAGTPEYVSKRIQDVIAKIMAKPDTKEKIAKYGGNIMTERGEQVASLIKNESLGWEKFAAEAGVQKE